MKTKMERKERSAIALPADLKNEFRKICIIQDLKPNAVAMRLFSTWIEKEKKRGINPANLIVNG